MNEFYSVDELIKHRNYQKQCDTENFFTERVLKKFKDDNVTMAKFIKTLNKNSVWKPDKFEPARHTQLEDIFD